MNFRKNVKGVALIATSERARPSRSNPVISAAKTDRGLRTKISEVFERHVSFAAQDDDSEQPDVKVPSTKNVFSLNGPDMHPAMNAGGSQFKNSNFPREE